MWSPTHVQVTVQRAKGLLTKGKNSTNNCFVTIALGKEKYQTSVRDKASQNVEWHEECELAIPDQGNKAELILTCLHHNNLGIDEFLGQITLPLRDFDAYDRPRSKWFKLQSKPGQEKKDKDRGELEVRINFTVKAGSLNDLSKKEKHKSSFNQLASSVGGSLLSIGTLEKKKGLKKFATSIGSKLHLTGKKNKDKNKDGSDSESFRGSIASIGTPNSSLGGSRKWNGKNYLGGNTDPGVADDGGGEIVFDKVSLRGSNSSLANGQEYNNYSPQNGISNARTSNPEIKIISENLNFSSPSSTPLQNRKSFPSNSNQLNIQRSDSLRRNSWGKPRIPLPIPENSEDNQIEDTEVELRSKGVPILNETRNSNIEVPETHKPKPRKFILGKENVEDDFSLDNLSVNSSPYSSITSQSFYDYSPDNDSRRASKKIDMDVEEDDFYGSFNRGDSKRRASRKKSFRPLSKENESDKQSFENLRSRDNQNIEEPEISIDFKPRPRTLNPSEMNDVNHKINSPQKSLNSSRNSLESLEEEIKIPQPRARSLRNSKVLNIENVIEENIAVVNEIPEKFEKIDSANVAFPNKIAQVFETRKEETASTKGIVVETEQPSPSLTVEVKELKTTNSQPNQTTTKEMNPDLVKIEKQVSSTTVQPGLLFKKENMEMAGALNNPSINISKLQNNDLGENEEEFYNSTSSINFEIRDLKNEEDEELNTPRLSVSNIRSMFEQNSTTKSSPSISPRHSLTPSKRNSVNINRQPQQVSNVSINLTQNVTPISKQVFESTFEYKANPYTSMARFEKANVENKSVESVIAQEIDQYTEENNAKTTNCTEVIQNVNLQNIAVNQNIAQVFEVKKEENIAVECSVPEIYENSVIENIAVESHIGQLLETRKEEYIAVDCIVPEVYNNVNPQHIAVEKNVAQVLEVKKEENIAVEFSVPEIYENSVIENIAVESCIGQLFETQNEECIAVECTIPESYENFNIQHFAIEKQIVQSLAMNTEENIAIETSFPESYNNINLEYIATDSYIPQVLETRKEENVAVQYSDAESYENSNIQHFAVEKQIAQSFAMNTEENIENIAVECIIPEIYENSNIENIAVESCIDQLFETQNEEYIAVECTIPESYENSNIQHFAIEKPIVQSLAMNTEENIAIETSFPESYNNINLEYIATDSYIPQVLETRKEENVAVQYSDAEPYENAVPEHILNEFEISQSLEQIQEENFAIEYNVIECFENANIKFNMVEQEIVETDDLELNKAPIPIPRSFENSIEQNIVEKFSIPEVFEKIKVEDIAIGNQIVQILDHIEIDNIAVDSNIRDVSEIINLENIANDHEIAEINTIQVDPELIGSFHSESELELNFQINNKNLNNDNKFIPIPRPQSPFDIINDDTNLNQSSSNILQMTKNNEDLPEIKKQILSNTQNNTINNNVNEESDYESVHSEPELKQNIEIKINSTNEFEEKPDSFETKLFKLMGDDYKRPPIPRPRNPNSDILNSLTDSSSSDCSSLENFNYMNDIAKKYKGNQDPGVIEDDDEFVFDKLSHKSSGSSINIRGHNEYNNQNRIPSPVMTMSKDDDIYRTNTTMTSTKSDLAAQPPPAKPPRNPSDQKLDEWEKKLYGNHLDIGNTDSLKRRSWGNNRIPLNTTEEQEEDYEDVKLSSPNLSNNSNSNSNLTINSNTSSPIIEKDLNKSPLTGNNITINNKLQRRSDTVLEKTTDIDDKINTIYEENHNDVVQQHQQLQKQKSPTVSIASTIETTSHLSDSDGGLKSEKKETKLEKFLTKTPPSLLRTKSREGVDDVENLNKTKNVKSRPRILPRSDTIGQFTDDTIKSPDDAKEIREKLKKDYKEISEKTEKIEKKHKFGKFKYFNKKVDRSDSTNEMGMHGERHNPIGHENFNDNENSLPELSQELLNKYEGKSREDIILLADSLEKDVIMERSRVKELEEYLDNLLLRVMETHPKILQNPYRTASTKSG